MDVRRITACVCFLALSLAFLPAGCGEDDNGSEPGPNPDTTVVVIPDSAIVVITSPRDGLVTNQTTVPVSWTVNGVVQTTQTSQSLVEGENLIIRRAVSSSGDTAADTVRVTCDPHAPAVAITSPRDGLVTNQTTVPVSWTVNGAVQNTQTSQSLVEGENLIIRTAVGPSGDTAADTVRVTCDTHAPVVVITSPRDGSSTAQSSVAVSWTVDGIAQTAQTTASLALGNNLIERSATDQAGNTGRAQVTVVRTDTGGNRLDLLSAPGQNSAVVVVKEGYVAESSANGMTADSEYVYGTGRRQFGTDTIAYTLGASNGGLRVRIADETTVHQFSFGAGGNAMSWRSPDGFIFELVSGTGWVTQPKSGSGSRLQGKGECTVRRGDVTLTVYFKFDFRIP